MYPVRNVIANCQAVEEVSNVMDGVVTPTGLSLPSSSKLVIDPVLFGVSSDNSIAIASNRATSQSFTPQPCLRSAVAYESQIFDEIPMQEHDVFMDYVITEQAVYQGIGR